MRQRALPNGVLDLVLLGETDVQIEVKLRCDRPDRLLTSKLRVTPIASRHFEEDWLYDLPGAEQSPDRFLRLRQVFDARRPERLLACVLTFKTAAPSDEAHPGKKVRRRVETSVGHGDRMVHILEQLGFRPRFRYEKYRSTYRVKLPGGPDLTVRFDETPIGNFLEIEGEDASIDALLVALGYDRSDAIELCYQALWEASRGAGRAADEGMLFARAEPHRVIG